MDEIKDKKSSEIGFDFTSDNKEFEKADKSTIKIPFAKIIAVGLMLSIVLGLFIGVGIGFVNNKFLSAENSKIETADQVETSNEKVILTTEEFSTIDIVEKVSPAVVGITSKVKYRDWFNNVRESQGSGSGVIFKKDEDKIYILTNNHVVDNTNELLVEIKNGDFQKAEVIGKDRMSDIAVISINNTGEYDDIIPVEFANSDLLKSGQKVIALGNPLGYNHTVTTGVISALGRELEKDNIFKLIQTDAAINPGNSGGALLDSQGRLIGINTIKISETSVEGMGFAIPVNSIKPIINELLENGYISRPYLGIYGEEVNLQASKLYELPMGIFVTQIIEDSGAYNSDLKLRDIIISIDGVKTFTMEDLKNVLSTHKVGDIITLKVIRNGETKKEVRVELTQRDE
ncbi:MAG: trypsin-like peptidase domain-containing protein [Clostridiales bacterium]|nr:trypsin-like peptidase domain-containing protein [Clostridiales bacterium]